LDELLELPLGSELQQEELFEPLLEPGFSSARVSTSLRPSSLAVFLVWGIGAQEATTREAARANAI
jgi:hypothetical protein